MTEALADMMIRCGFVTGHGDTVEDLVAELEPQVVRLRAEVARLQSGGCARDQRLTQYCAEAERLRAEVARLNDGWESVARREDEMTAESDRLRELLREARAYVVSDHGWSYEEPTGWLADRIDAALKEGS